MRRAVVDAGRLRHTATRGRATVHRRRVVAGGDSARLRALPVGAGRGVRRWHAVPPCDAGKSAGTAGPPPAAPGGGGAPALPLAESQRASEGAGGGGGGWDGPQLIPYRD